MAKSNKNGNKNTQVKVETATKANEGKDVVKPVIETSNVEVDSPVEESVQVDVPVEESVDLTAERPVVEPALLGRGEARKNELPNPDVEIEPATDGENAVFATIAQQAPALADALRNYVSKLTANSGADVKSQVSAQVRLFNNLVAVFDQKGIDIRNISDELTELVQRNLEGAFSIRLMMRNMDVMPLTESQRALFQALLHLYRTAASRGRKAAGEEIDIPRIAELYVKAYPRKEHGAMILPELFKV